jgi:hypothetical protein
LATFRDILAKVKEMLIILLNAGSPMIILEIPLMLLTLLPIIIVEAVITHSKLKLLWKQAFFGVAIANLFSTLLGVPLAWLAMLLIKLISESGFHILYKQSPASVSPLLDLLQFFLSVAWLGPQYTFINIISALIILLIPSYYVSVLMERKICRSIWRNQPRELVDHAVIYANRVSYLCLFMLTFAFLFYIIYQRGFVRTY